MKLLLPLFILSLLLSSCDKHNGTNDEQDLLTAERQMLHLRHDSASVAFQALAQGSKDNSIRARANVGLMRMADIEGHSSDFHKYAELTEPIVQSILNSSSRFEQSSVRAVCGYYLALSSYYSNMRMPEKRNEALGMLQSPAVRQMLLSDTLSLCEFYIQQSRLQDSQSRLSSLGRALALGLEHSDTLYVGLALSRISHALLHGSEMRPSFAVLMREYLDIPDTVDLLSAMMQRGTECLMSYGNPYYYSTTLITNAEMLIGKGHLTAASDTLGHALHVLNQHLLEQNHSFADTLTVSAANAPDLDWIMSEETSGVCPLWIARLRHQYAELDSALAQEEMASATPDTSLISKYQKEAALSAELSTRITDISRRDLQLHWRHQSLQRHINIVGTMTIVYSVSIPLLILLLCGLCVWKYYRTRQRIAEQDALADSYTESFQKEQKANLEKRTCISLLTEILPLIDRLKREVERGGISYSNELLQRISHYNNVVTQWIKIRHGSLSVHIENFDIIPLLKDVCTHNVSLANTIPTEAQVAVKADKALTMFMLNTLVTNARKFTPDGSSINLSIEQKDDYVEISVNDTGNGLSPADVDKINNQRTYDPASIGTSSKGKGFGFGLINCRNIIESYKRLNRRFAMCAFGVESTLGKGSRFWFRLAGGRLRNFILTTGLLLAASAIWAAPLHDDTQLGEEVIILESRLHDDRIIVYTLLAVFVLLLILGTASVVWFFRRMNQKLSLAKDNALFRENEYSRLHIQNNIIDNALSTIKHETISYPSYISRELNSSTTEDSTAVISAINNYRSVFSILLQNLQQQVHKPLFRRHSILPIKLLARILSDGEIPTPTIEAGMHKYIFDCKPTNEERKPDSIDTPLLDTPDILFSVDSIRVLPDGTLTNADYLIAKQIVRELDATTSSDTRCRLTAENVNNHIRFRVLIP